MEEREIEQEDFLDLRLGMGNTELRGNVSFPEEHFSLESDNLLQEVYKLGAESRILENVPVSLSFVKNRVKFEENICIFNTSICIGTWCYSASW